MKLHIEAVLCGAFVAFVIDAMAGGGQLAEKLLALESEMASRQASDVISDSALRSLRDEIIREASGAQDAAEQFNEVLNVFLLESDAPAMKNLAFLWIMEDFAAVDGPGFLSYAEKFLVSGTSHDALKSELLVVLARIAREKRGSISEAGVEGSSGVTDEDIVTLFTVAAGPGSSKQVRDLALRNLFGAQIHLDSGDVVDVRPMSRQAGIQALKTIVASDMPFTGKEEYWRRLAEETSNWEPYNQAASFYVKDEGNDLYYRYKIATGLESSGIINQEEYQSIEVAYRATMTNSSSIHVQKDFSPQE